MRPINKKIFIVFHKNTKDMPERKKFDEDWSKKMMKHNERKNLSDC